MPLSLTTRHVGDLTVVACQGRIVEGDESVALTTCMDRDLAYRPWLLLHLGEVEFIDSSGLGLLVRLLMRLKHAGGDLKLCAVTPRVAAALTATRLNTVLERYDTEDEALAAFSRPIATTSESSQRADVLCAAASNDVLTFVREVLRQAGYGVVTATNLADAKTVLAASRPKLVVIDARLHQTATNGQADGRFASLTRDLPIVDLAAEFSRADAAGAAAHLLHRVRNAMPAA